MLATNAPDPYLALGLTSDATAAQIKTAYRKLVLTCHPDKVQDETKKAAATDNFHKIQTAYELLSDDKKRGKYDASVRLFNLQKEFAQQQPSATRPSPHQPTHTAAFEVPLTTPRGTAYSSYATRGPERYDQTASGWFDSQAKFTDFVPNHYAEEESYFGTRSQYPETRRSSYSIPKRHAQSPRTEAPRKSASKEAERASRHDKKKHTDRDRRQERESKTTPHVVREDSVSDSDEDVDPRRTRRDGRRPSLTHRQTRRTSSDSDTDTGITRKMRQASFHIQQTRVDKPRHRVSPVDYEPVRRSAAPSPVRDHHRSRHDNERERKNSDPSHYTSRRRDHGHYDKPSFDRTSSMPVERSKAKHAEDKNPGLKRNATMPVPPRRPEGQPRTESKLRHTTDAASDDSPTISPRRGDSGSSSRPKLSRRVTTYTVGDDGRAREHSPMTSDRMRVASPERYHDHYDKERDRDHDNDRHRERDRDHDNDRRRERDRDRHRDHDRDHEKDKSRSKTASVNRHHAPTPPKLTRIQTTGFATAILGERFSDSPRSARPSAHRTDSAPIIFADSFGTHRSADRDKESAHGRRHDHLHHHTTNEPDDLYDREVQPDHIRDRHRPGLEHMINAKFTDFVPTPPPRMEAGRVGSGRRSSKATVPTLFNMKKGSSSVTVGR